MNIFLFPPVKLRNIKIQELSQNHNKWKVTVLIIEIQICVYLDFQKHLKTVCFPCLHTHDTLFIEKLLLSVSLKQNSCIQENAF